MVVVLKILSDYFAFVSSVYIYNETRSAVGICVQQRISVGLRIISVWLTQLALRSENLLIGL